MAADTEMLDSISSALGVLSIAAWVMYGLPYVYCTQRCSIMDFYMYPCFLGVRVGIDRPKPVSLTLRFTNFAFFAFSLISCYSFFSQIYETYLVKSGSGINLYFVSVWIVGDIFNVMGCIFTTQLPTQVYDIRHRQRFLFVFVNMLIVS